VGSVLGIEMLESGHCEPSRIPGWLVVSQKDFTSRGSGDEGQDSMIVVRNDAALRNGIAGSARHEWDTAIAPTPTPHAITHDARVVISGCALIAVAHFTRAPRG
jgi:hypothetical protein